MIKNFILFCLFLTGVPFIAAAQFNQQNNFHLNTTNQVNDDWQNAAEAYITADGYHFKQDGANCYAANKKQRTGAVIYPAGFAVTPLLVSDKTAQWSFNLQLSYIGKGMTNMYSKAAGQQFSPAGANNITVKHSSFDIQYINTEEGLRQNFVINKKPTGDQPLSVSLQVSGSLEAAVNNNELQLKDANGYTKLFYRDLKVWDANQQPLAANMKLKKNGQLDIIIDDSKAVYPVTVDPINQTPEWTTSADGILPTLVGQLAVDAAYGFSVAGLGDVNGDGFDDVAVGAPAAVDIISGTGTLASVGAVFVYYGSVNGLPVVPSAKLQPTTAVAGALFGYSIAGGDINNDGKADIIVGAPLDNVSLSIGGGSTATGKVGKAYVFNGATLSTNTTPFLNLQLSGTGILENGINLSVKALFGFSVAVTEDLNNDGKKDIIVGAPAYAGIKAGLLGTKILDVQSGGAFVFLSNSNNNFSITKLEPVKTNLLGLGLLESNISGLLFGYSVDGLGDYNGDGKADVVATAPAGVNAGSISALLNGKLLQGSALVYYGNGNGVNSNPCATLTATSGGLLTNLVGSLGNVANLFGTSVKGVKQANGVRNGNVLVGAPLGNAVINVLNLQLKTGTVSVFKKKTSSPSGYVVPDQVLTSPRNSNNILQIIQCNLLFGYALDNVLDINCDGYADIIVGEPASSGVQLINANVAGGAAYVFLGKADGTYQAAPAWTLTATTDAFLGVNATSLIGYSVAGAGKVKGCSGNNKILIGSPSRSLDFGTGLLNLGNTFGTLFSLVAGHNGVGKAFLFDTKLCIINVTVSKADPLCCGDASGSFTLTASGGTGALSYSKDGGATFQSCNTFTGLAAGTYNWVVKDAAGNTTSGQVIIANPPSINASASVVRKPTNPETADGSFKITASGGTGTLTYSKDGGCSFQSSNTFTCLYAGTYNWVVKDANGCRRGGQITLTCNAERNINHSTGRNSSQVAIADKPVIQTESRLKIYPNPASSFVNVSFVPSEAGKLSVGLYSINGKYITSLYSGVTDPGKLFQQKFSLGKLAAGTYIIRLKNGNTIFNEKLFVLD